MLEIWLSLCRMHGISEVLVNTHSHAEAVKSFIRNHEDGVRVTVVEEAELFGSAGTLRMNRHWIGSESTFWVFYADVLTCANLSRMIEFHLPDSAATLGVYSVPDPQRCGIVSVDKDDVITDFVEKPACPKGNLAFAGLLVGTQDLLNAIPDQPIADLAFDVLPHLTRHMRAYAISDYLVDIGTVENYESAQTTWPGLFTESAA